MAMDFKQAASVMVDGNKEAFKASAKMRTGKMINKRVVGVIAPRLPLMIRGYAQSDLGEAVIANIVAMAIIKYLPTNEKAVLAADAMIVGAADEFIGSFNIEEMIDEVLDGINLDTLKDVGNTARKSTATGLRKASDIVDTDTEVA